MLTGIRSDDVTTNLSRKQTETALYHRHHLTDVITHPQGCMVYHLSIIKLMFTCRIVTSQDLQCQVRQMTSNTLHFNTDHLQKGNCTIWTWATTKRKITTKIWMEKTTVWILFELHKGWHWPKQILRLRCLLLRKHHCNCWIISISSRVLWQDTYNLNTNKAKHLKWLCLFSIQTQFSSWA